VLLALEHEKGSARARIAFGPAGLELLDLHGPRYLAAARLEPVRAGVFRLLLGETPKKLEFELGPDGATRARLGRLEFVRG